MTTSGLHSGFVRNALAHPDRVALEVDGEALTYAELKRRAYALAATLAKHRAHGGAPLTCVLGQRTASGFAGILAALCSGHGYVPMLPTYPAARLTHLIERAQARALVVDAGGRRVLDDVLGAVETSLTVVLPDQEVDAAMRSQFDRHVILGKSDLESGSDWEPPTPAPDDIAYLMFTSGSTGQPKGVMVAHRNIERFLDVVRERYGLRHTDRFSHMFEVTFDLSLFDMFAAWTVGGCLCCPNAQQRMLPARYVVESELSVWFCVPSTALLMSQTRTLTEGAFPGLRLSLFCGEALPVAVAQAWAESAPNSIVENIYGPTELTLACTHFRYGQAALASSAIVPIGDPFPGMHARVVDDALREVEPGQTGELLMTGPQVALGYWQDPERTEAAFVVPPGASQRFYRTGDRVRRPHGTEPLEFLGRIDHQIKVRGHRVELGEIEAAIREEASVDAAVALGWPEAAGGTAAGLVAFIDDASVDIKELIGRLGARLPRYMVPRRVHLVDEFPLNPNGKIDRNALRAMLQ